MSSRAHCGTGQITIKSKGLAPLYKDDWQVSKLLNSGVGAPERGGWRNQRWGWWGLWFEWDKENGRFQKDDYFRLDMMTLRGHWDSRRWLEGVRSIGSGPQDRGLKNFFWNTEYERCKRNNNNRVLLPPKSLQEVKQKSHWKITIAFGNWEEMDEEMLSCAHFTGNGKLSSESQGIQAPLSSPPVIGSREVLGMCARDLTLR